MGKSGPDVEPDFPRLFLHFRIGGHGAAVLLAFVLVLGKEVAVGLESSARSLGAGVGVRVFAVDAHRGFHVLDARCWRSPPPGPM